MSEEAIKKEFEVQGWKWIERNLYVKWLAVTASRWKSGHPDHELIAVKGKDRFYYLFYRPKQRTLGTRKGDTRVSGAELPADFVTSLRRMGHNWKYIFEAIREKLPNLPENVVVDRIISKHIGRGNLKKAIYIPERRIVFTAPADRSQYYFFVEGVGVRRISDLSFDQAEISALEKISGVTGEYLPEIRYHVDEIKKIIREYRLGYIDAATAIEDIDEVVMRM